VIGQLENMLYKFDILFKKSLNSGGQKVVTYSSLLENSDIFGEGEGLVGAEGELSMVLEGPEEGFSINALYRKYRAQLVGRQNAQAYGKDFPLRFSFAKPDDASSITYAAGVSVQRMEGSRTLDWTDMDTFVLLIAQGGACTITDGDNATRLQPGQAAFCGATTHQLTIETDSTLVALYNTSKQ